MTVIEIGLSELDLEQLKDVVYNNETITWTFELNGEQVQVQFMSEDEQEQRGK